MVCTGTESRKKPLSDLPPNNHIIQVFYTLSHPTRPPLLLHSMESSLPTQYHSPALTNLSNTLHSHYPILLLTILILPPPTTTTTTNTTIPTTSHRIFTTNPALHPLGPRDPTVSYPHQNSPAPPPPRRAELLQRVIVQGKPWIGTTKEDLRDVFEDWEVLWEAGLGSVINFPVGVGGEVIGTVNMLGAEGALKGVDLRLMEGLVGEYAGEVERIRREIGW